MKRTLWITTPVLSAFIWLICGCQSFKQMQKETIETAVTGYIIPQQLEAVNGVVTFTYTIHFAPKEFNKKTILKITPKIQYNNQTMDMQAIFLQGEHVRTSSYPVISHKTGSSFSQQISFPFKPGMENGIIWADIETIHGKKSVFLTPVMLYENGIKVWQQPAFTLNGINYIPAMTETIVKDVPATAVGVVSGYLMFPLGQSTITQSEQRSSIMTQATKAMEEVLADKNATLTNLFIYISNSPEGTERLNKELATNRFQSTKNFLVKKFKLSDTIAKHKSKFIVQQTVDENWNGLYALLENSNISNKTAIIKELKNATNATARGQLIDKYITQIPELKNVILPILRRADFYLFYTEPALVEEEIELTYFVPQLEEKTPAVTAQSNWQLLNNLAVIAIHNRDYHKAKKLLEAAIALKEDATINNNLGIVHAQLGHKQTASQYFNKAQLRKEARYNMGLLLAQNEEYKKAIPYLKEYPNDNLAFAQLMNNDNHAALETFHKIKTKNALDYYLMAVAAARTKNKSEMTTSLSKALQMQPELKKWAASDIAFYPYKEDPAYQNLVK